MEPSDKSLTHQEMSDLYNTAVAGSLDRLGRRQLTEVLRLVILEMIDVLPPDLVIPAVPPSVNIAMRGQAGQRKYGIEKKLFKSHVWAALRADSSPPSNVSPLAHPPCVVLFRVFFATNREHDQQNCEKAITDALYEDDSKVLPWPLFGGVDKKNPRTEIWTISLNG